MKYPTPIEDKYIVLPEKVEEEKKGLLIPDEMKQKPRIGIIKAAGKGIQAENAEWIEMQAKVGDRVLYQRRSGDSIMIGDVEHFILKQSELLLIL